ncbi:MAG TPA: hypothetical protein VMD92_06325 [Acidobacteriaceae bacterium]|jgi:hypothetical protein|nr:hypothetical protein [Acidobacteriaceae bacterium]
MRSVVLICGVLRGMGHEAGCEMVAIKDKPPDSPRPIYSRWSVIDAPRDLPDGRYTVSFENYTVPVRREGGLWLAEESSVTDAA